MHNRFLPRTSPLRRCLGAVLFPALLSSCASPKADTSALDEARELTIACDHGAALAAIDRATASGVPPSTAELQRVVILRDAGRTMDAARVLRLRNALPEVTVEDAVHSGTAVEEGLADLRGARSARTGRPYCH